MYTVLYNDNIEIYCLYDTHIIHCLDNHRKATVQTLFFYNITEFAQNKV